MTPKQAAILAHIKDTTDALGRPPYIRELAAAMHYRSTNSVHAILRALKAKGLITWTPWARRGIRITGGERQ